MNYRLNLDTNWTCPSTLLNSRPGRLLKCLFFFTLFHAPLASPAGSKKVVTWWQTSVGYSLQHSCRKFLKSSKLEPNLIVLESTKLCNKPVNRQWSTIPDHWFHWSHDHKIRHHEITFFESVTLALARARTWTAQSGVERTNHEAITPARIYQ